MTRRDKRTTDFQPSTIQPSILALLYYCQLFGVTGNKKSAVIFLDCLFVSCCLFFFFFFFFLCLFADSVDADKAAYQKFIPHEQQTEVKSSLPFSA